METPESSNVWDDILKSVICSSSCESLPSHYFGSCFLQCNTVARPVLKESCLKLMTIQRPTVLSESSYPLSRLPSAAKKASCVTQIHTVHLLSQSVDVAENCEARGTHNQYR